METPRPRQKASTLSASLPPAARRRLTHFKAFAVSHPLLQRVDTALMQAIREPAGFSHVWSCTCPLRINTAGSPVDYIGIKKS
jgi:hypothetical protein